MAQRGIFDQFSDTMMSPLFLGGAALLSGEGMGGAMQGMQAGNQFAAQRQKQAEQQQRRQAFDQMMQGGQFGGVPPEMMKFAQAAGPDAGIEMLAKAYRNPEDIALKKAQINKLNREAAMGSETPSNVREWQYFQGLPPEKQQQYLTMKRAEKYLDAGTNFVRPNPVDPSKPVAMIPKDVAGKEFQEQVGQAQGKAAAAAPGDINAADDALKILDQIETHPGLNIGTGFTSYGNSIRGTEGHAFQALVDQAKSGAFLSAIQQLRGMGALSNAEGDTATKAVTRMNTALKNEDFLKAHADYKSIVVRGKEVAQKRLQKTQPQQRPDPLGIMGGN